MNKRIVHIALAALLMWGVGLCVLAQRKGTGEMDEKCNQWYTLAKRNIEDKKCLLYADSIRARGRRRGLNKTEFRADEICAYHYAQFNNFTMLSKATEALRKSALAENEMCMYYHTYEMEVHNRLAFGMTLDALKRAKEMQTVVAKSGSSYANYIAQRTLGEVYYSRREYKQAIRVLDSALVYEDGARKERKGLKTADTYTTLASAQYFTRHWDESRRNYDTALQRSLDWKDSVSVCLRYTLMLAYVNREKDFRRLYAMTERLANKRALDDGQMEAFVLLKGYKAMYDKEKDVALMLADCVQDNERKVRLLRDIYYNCNEPFNALEMESRLIALKDSIYFRLTKQDLVLLNLQFNNNALRSQADLEEQELSDLEMRQVKQRSDQLEERNRLNEEQYKIRLREAYKDSLEMEAERKKAQIKLVNDQQELMRMQAAGRKMYSRNTLICMAIYLLSIIGIGAVFVLRRVRSTAKNIGELNVQLAKAHAEASNMNKIKTAFIQNMNYEVRSPLNEVTGFAQVLSSSDIAVTEDERLEYGQHITDSAMALNALIDNILTIADIESGKREVAWQQSSASSILKTAKNNIMQTSPSGVTLRCADDECAGITLVTDARRVAQVIAYLARNSFKHKQHGEMTIACEEDAEGNVVFSVADTIGKPADEMLEGIEQSLHDGQEASTAPMMDLGLCRLMTDRLDGQIVLDKTYDKGVKINLILKKRHDK